MHKKEEQQLQVFGYGLPLICFFLAWRQYAKHGASDWAKGLIVAGIMVLLMGIFARP